MKYFFLLIYVLSIGSLGLTQHESKWLLGFGVSDGISSQILNAREDTDEPVVAYSRNNISPGFGFGFDIGLSREINERVSISFNVGYLVQKFMRVAKYISMPEIGMDGNIYTPISYLTVHNTYFSYIFLVDSKTLLAKPGKFEIGLNLGLHLTHLSLLRYTSLYTSSSYNVPIGGDFNRQTLGTQVGFSFQRFFKNGRKVDFYLPELYLSLTPNISEFSIRYRNYFLGTRIVFSFPPGKRK